MTLKSAPIAAPHARAHLLATAGLLHDVGKILEPAGAEIPPNIRGLESFLCPTDLKSQRSTHRHALFTAAALDGATSNYGGLDPGEVFRVACYHHRPSTDSFEQNLLTKADWIASGHDRKGVDEPGDPVTGLRPILGRVVWPDVHRSPSDSVLETVPFGFSINACLPTDTQTRQDYSARCTELSRLLAAGLTEQFPDPAACVEGWNALLERVAHAVPSSRSRQQIPDVNLYDHSRVVAAFASCLAVQHDTGPCDPRQIQGQYRLIGISLGRIQSFLLRSLAVADQPVGESTDKGMAKRLRAKSFYVGLLSWLAGQRILDALGLPVVHRILDAGGRTILLIPETESVGIHLHEALAWIRTWFNERFAGTVRCDLAISDVLNDQAFHLDRFSQTFREFDQQLQMARLRNPFSDDAANPSWTSEGWVSDSVTLPVDQSEFQEKIARLGDLLPKSRYLSLQPTEQGSLDDAFDVLGYRIRLHQQLPMGPRVFALGVWDDDRPTMPIFLWPQHVPVATAETAARLQHRQTAADHERPEAPSTPGELLTFEELSALSTDDLARPLTHQMLGVLKADVDHLGTLLSYGLGNEASFGRLAALARTLNGFFKGFLNERLKEEFPLIYTVFTGGDDLFLIGPWYNLVRFVASLQDWFRRLSVQNPNLTFSAGLVFAQSRVPVRSLASLADAAIDTAKDAGRNRITVGSRVLTWEQFHRGLQLHGTLRRLALGEASPLNRSLLYRLLTYSQMAADSYRSVTATGADLKWRSQMSYDLKRNLPLDSRHSQANDLRELHSQLMSIRTADDALVLHWACLLTLYSLRGEAS